MFDEYNLQRFDGKESNNFIYNTNNPWFSASSEKGLTRDEKVPGSLSLDDSSQERSSGPVESFTPTEEGGSGCFDYNNLQDNVTTVCNSHDSQNRNVT